ncbi:MAG: radical SAM/SPASM domain-containing protein [Candidatus Pacearchaeota archaeon]
MDLKYLIKELKYYKKLKGLSRAIKKYSLSRTFLKNSVNSPFYNKIYGNNIKKKAKILKPYILQIENTNLCNARCVMCPHTIMKRKAKVMSLKNFKKIINNVLNRYDIKKLVITGFGEPFMDKNLIDKIKYINEKYPKLKIEIYTNASLLDQKTADEILKTKIEKMTFSINGTESNYKKIMGLDYEKTKNNVVYFLKKNKELGNPILTNVSLMILKENEIDVKNFIDFWSPFSDSVRVYPPSDWAGALNEMVKRPSFKYKRWPCMTLWNAVTVDVEGKVIMCCRDYESKVTFGNLINEDILKIRESKKFQDLLKNQLDFEFSTPICSKCDNSFDSSLDWW